MNITKPFNLQKWIDDNSPILKPPVGNKNLYLEAEDFIVMIVAGPNARKDYHYNETEELFYQVEGDIIVKTQQNGKMVKVPVKEGEMFLLPPKVPHSPVRSEGSIGLVIEKKRKESELDGLEWYCEQCNENLHKTTFPLTNIEKDFLPRFKEFYGSDQMRTCNSCGNKMESDNRFI